MNQQMADRMLHRNSQLDHKIMKKSMDEYVKIKKTITNNKRALSVSRVTGPLPTISLNRSTKKVILK